MRRSGAACPAPSTWKSASACRRALPAWATSLVLIDAGGQVIDEYGPRYADCDLPVIDGLVADPRAIPPKLDRARSQLVFRLLAELRTRPDLGKRVSQIDVQDAHDVHVILDDDPAVLRLGDTQFVERLESYVGLQAALRERVPEIDYVDLRFGDRVYVGPSPVGGRAIVKDDSRRRWRRRRRRSRSPGRSGRWRRSWDAKSGTWSGSTSAPRRSRPSSAR